MARETLAETWTAVTLTKNETWVAFPEQFMVHCFNGTVPDGSDGAVIRAGDSITFVAGQTVYHKTIYGRGGVSTFTRVEVGV